MENCVGGRYNSKPPDLNSRTPNASDDDIFWCFVILRLVSGLRAQTRKQRSFQEEHRYIGRKVEVSEMVGAYNSPEDAEQVE